MQEQENEQERERLRIVLHELSNLLTGILVNAGLIGTVHPGDRCARYAQRICEGGERAAALVRDARTILTPQDDRFTTKPAEYAND